jgi:hypothetical protein
MADEPDEPGDETRERPRKTVLVRKLTEEERNARAQALAALAEAKAAKHRH